MHKAMLNEMKFVLLLALVCVVRSRTLNQTADESGMNLEDGETIWEGDMILTKEQAEELYGKNPEISNDISERHYPSNEFGDGFQIREGDMRLSEDQMQALYGQFQGRSFYSDGRTLWPNGIVPYKIHESARMHEENISKAIRKLEDVTCIKFVKYAGNPNSRKHVYFYTNESNPGDCSSDVGMSKNESKVPVHLGIKGCGSVGTILHEIGHAIGFFHEQTRMDRDSYVKILYENTNEDKFNNNFKKEKSLHNHYDIPYDYGSLMHYGLAYFSKNGDNTLIPYNPKYTLEIGQRTNLSFSDIKLANLMYNCSAKCSKKPLCKNEGFVDKNCECQCPNEYEGPNCDDKVPSPDPACGGMVNESVDVIITPNYPWNPPTGTKCIWEFKAPAGKNVQVFFQRFHLRGRNTKDNTCDCDQVHIRGGGKYNGAHTYCENELNAQTITISPHVNGTFVIFKACDPEQGTAGVFSATVTFT